jgi:hypothetical protein
MAPVGGQQPACVRFVENQHVITQLVAQGLDDRLAVGVYAGCLGCGLEDVDLFGLEDGVERGGVLVIPVA